MNSTQATANDNVSAATVTTENGVTVYRNIKARDYKRAGRMVEGQTCRGQHAAVEAGKLITLWGVDRNNVKGFRPYRIEFKIGDSAEYDSYNLSYQSARSGGGVAVGAREADEFTARFRRDREIEAELAEVEAQALRLRSLLSTPRAGRLREMRLAEAYRSVLDDVRRLERRGLTTFGAGSNQAVKVGDLRAFLERRVKVIE